MRQIHKSFCWNLEYNVTLKIHKKSKLDWNQLKLATQHKYMYMYQKNNKNWRDISTYMYMYIRDSMLH